MSFDTWIAAGHLLSMLIYVCTLYMLFRTQFYIQVTYMVMQTSHGRFLPSRILKKRLKRTLNLNVLTDSEGVCFQATVTMHFPRNWAASSWTFAWERRSIVPMSILQHCLALSLINNPTEDDLFLSTHQSFMKLGLTCRWGCNKVSVIEATGCY